MMRKLNKTENAVFAIGAVLMLVGVVCRMFVPSLSAYIYSIGAIMFVVIQLRQRYEGTNIAIKRLRRIVIISDFLLLFTGVMMFADRSYDFMGLDILTWLQYVHNNWVVTLLIAAVIQLYTTFRIDAELVKDTKKM